MRKPKVFKSMTEVNSYIQERVELLKVDAAALAAPMEGAGVRSDFAEVYDFRACTFDFKVDFKGTNFPDEVDFSDATFNDEANFKGCIFMKSVKFRFCNILGRAVFGSIKFKSTANFYRCNFTGRADFRKTKFMKQADFSESKFTAPAFFHNSVFKDIVLFRFAKFENEADFYEATFATLANFDLCVFNYRAFFNKISQEEPKRYKTELSFVSALFASTAHFNNCHLYHIDLNSAHTDKVITFYDSTVKDANRETYRVLKNQFLKENNNVLALKYYRREMNERMRENLVNVFPFELSDQAGMAIYLPGNAGLSIKKRTDISFMQMLLSVFELFSLTLHRVSNSHGTSWGRGLLFFLLTSILTFFLFCLSMQGNSILNVHEHFDIQHFELMMKYYPQFINPAHKISNFEGGLQLTGFSYVIDLFGRILSTYAIFQIIQAFRKYRSS